MTFDHNSHPPPGPVNVNITQNLPPEKNLDPRIKGA